MNKVRSSRRPVHLIGVPTDINSSFLRGCAAGPAEVRAALNSDHGNSAAENGLEIGQEITLSDLGDVPINENESDDEAIAAAVTRSTLANALPISIGGDHWITAPIVKALALIHGPLTILHIDAHPDLYDEMQGSRRSHACPFSRIIEAGATNCLVQIGLRTINCHQREQAQRFGIVEQFPARGFVASQMPELAGPLYITIDLDGIDPSEAPGVSHHEPGGLSVREVLDIFDRQPSWLAGADIVELNPSRDVNGVTAVLAAKLVREISAMDGAA